jgi:hypothetical protein
MYQGVWGKYKLKKIERQRIVERSYFHDRKDKFCVVRKICDIIGSQRLYIS